MRYRMAFTMIGAAFWGAQASAGETVALPSGRITAEQAAELGVPEAELPQLRALKRAAERQKAKLLKPGSLAGIRLQPVAPGEFAAVPVTTATPRATIVDRESLDLLGRFTPRAIREGMAAGQTLRPTLPDRFNIYQSVPPPELPDKDKAPSWLRGLMERFGYKGPVQASIPGPESRCADAQGRFNSKVEPQLQPGGSPFTTTDAATRRSRVEATHDFETHCLTAVAAGAADTDRLVLILDGFDRAVCTGLHLGGRRFLTARHCFDDKASGQRLTGMSHPKVAFARYPEIGPVPIQMAAVQPYGTAAAGFISAQDLAIVEAPALPEDRAAQPAIPTGDIASTTEPAEEARVIGYFALADPERRFPKPGQPGTFAPWRDALRMSRATPEGGCRVWSRSLKPQGGCLEHSCQTIPGFSGAPVYVRRTTADGTSKWLLAGLNVAGASSKTVDQCGVFRPAIASGTDTGILIGIGAVAALLPPTLATAGVALASTSKEPRP